MARAHPWTAAHARTLAAVPLDTIVEQIQAHVRAELDYLREAELGLRVGRFFADAVHGNQRIVTPALIPALCCPTVLTTHFIAARKITAVLDELSAQGANGDAAAARPQHAVATTATIALALCVEQLCSSRA